MTSISGAEPASTRRRGAIELSHGQFVLLLADIEFGASLVEPPVARSTAAS